MNTRRGTGGRLWAIGLALAIMACDGGSSLGTSSPAPACTHATDCDDGLSCTVDRCGDDGYCAWSLREATCLVHGVCAEAGQERPSAPCEVCDPASPHVWTLAADTPCDDGDACTIGDTCRAGRCEGEPLVCDSGDACTRAVCDPARGCVATVLAGFTCDDGTRCTLDDRCDAAGECVGRPNRCDDNNPCTTDACDEVVGCVNAPQDGTTCALADACVIARCEAGACVAAEPRVCDDGNPCTIDTCDASAGCVHLPTMSPCCIGVTSVCDDGNPCTDDACDAQTGECSHTPNANPCDDQNACTTGDVCVDGACVAGGGLACDDGNPCTDDACNPALQPPCVHSPRAGACDDGIACTTDEVCVNGRCRGDTSQCVCEPDLAADGVKLSSVQIGTDGAPGQGVDVDLNPATCAPADTCSGGVDNSLSILAGFANESLATAVSRGEVMLVLGLTPVGVDPVTVAIYQARLATEGCDFNQATCDYLVDRSFLDPATCAPVAALTGTRTGNRLVAGGPGTRLPFNIPLGGAELEVVIANLRLELDLTVDGGQVAAASGVLGGAVRKQTLIDALRAVPDESLPAPKEALISLVETLVVMDIDSDGDGVLDAASIGVKVVARDARLVGVAP